MRGSPVDMNEVERVLALKSFSGFAHLGPDDLAMVARQARPLRFDAGERLFRAGRRVRDLHFVLEGRIAVTRNERVLFTFGPGELVGGYAGLADDPRGVHAVAEEPSTTLQVRRSDMEELVEENFDLLLSVIGALAKDLIRARQSLERAGYDELDDASRLELPDKLGLVGRMLLLQNTRTFGGARIEMLSELAQSARAVRLDAGELLWREGDEATHLLVLHSGTVQCQFDGGAQHFERGPRDVLGTHECVGGRKRWYEARAGSEVIALELGAVQLVDILEDNVDMALEAMRGFAATTLWLRERLARYSRELADAK